MDFNNTKFSISEKFGIDVSSKDNMVASIKAKKLIGDATTNNFFTNLDIKSNEFTSDLISLILFEKINKLEEEIKKINNTQKVQKEIIKTQTKLKELEHLINNCQECKMAKIWAINECDNKIKNPFNQYQSKYDSVYISSTSVENYIIADQKNEMQKITNNRVEKSVCQNHKTTIDKIIKLSFTI